MTYTIGIDLGGTNIVAGLVDSDGQILAKASLPTLAGRPAQAILGDIATLARNVASEAGIALRDIGSVGVGSPGSVNKSTGLIECSPNLDWSNVPLRDTLSAELNHTVYIENDANAAAFGEYIIGAAKDYDTFLMITLGTGIGGGMVQHGVIYEGFNFAGMEVGHMVVTRGGRPCRCGRHGCFERYASATGLILTAREYMARYPASLLWELASGDPENVDGRMPFDAMEQGDLPATEAVRAYTADLACGITNLINIFQPDILAVGGGIAGQGERLLAPLREIVAQEVYSRDSARNTKIVAAQLGNDAGIIGAANLYRENIGSIETIAAFKS
ncbi:MAG: ROK family protein [Clostridiales Family XIII bacterium]|nr:ROK family protein [Clostridiales Family XIII bacterium]